MQCWGFFLLNIYILSLPLIRFVWMVVLMNALATSTSINLCGRAHSVCFFLLFFLFFVQFVCIRWLSLREMSQITFNLGMKKKICWISHRNAHNFNNQQPTEIRNHNPSTFFYHFLFKFIFPKAVHFKFHSIILNKTKSFFMQQATTKHT